VRILGVPRYLREKGKEKRMNRIARFRLESEMREGRFWEEGEKMKCRLYGWEEETWEHVVEVCMRKEGARGKVKIVKIMNEEGGEEGWIKRLQKKERNRGGWGKEKEGEKQKTD